MTFRTTRRTGLRTTARITVAAACAALAMSTPASPASAASYASLNGGGSSWAQVAIDQWIEDEHAVGMTVNYTGNGSAAGRNAYGLGQYDFAGSDPPFRDGSDKLAGQNGKEVPQFGYSYVPDTAGGTAFMYHLTMGGHRITNLRLHPSTLFKIFTGQITNWSNRQITSDYGGSLPNEPIVPVVRADGSGATFMFTRWMAKEDPGDWNAFCRRVAGVSGSCGTTEFYPGNFGHAKAQNGSPQSAGYVASGAGEGSIAYDEYAYALNDGLPVVKVANPGGYWIGPTASAVAVGLTKAQIYNNPNDAHTYLQQNLDNVYTNRDIRSYPLSSYSYLIVPRDNQKVPSAFNNNKGRSLSTFIQHMLCEGQRTQAQLGYSPLPINLVSGAMNQMGHVPGHIGVPKVTPGFCNNPQYNLLHSAPYPGPCDKVGAPLHCKVVNGKAVNLDALGGGGNGANGSGAGGSNGAGANGAGANGAGANGAGANGLNPETGAANGSGNGSGLGSSALSGQAVGIAANGADKVLLSLLTALGVLAAVAAPPAVGEFLRRRRQRLQGT